MDSDTAFVQAALDRQLFSPEEGQEALTRARSTSRPVSDLLVEQGLLAPRTVAALQEDLARKSGAAGGAGNDAPTLSLPAPASASVLVAGEYELREKLGEGGMGAVYRAVQRSLQRSVAIKVLAPTYAASADAAARFVREARAAAAVGHPNVITVFHVGQERGRLFMVMELVTGGDADQLARKHGGRLPERRALEVVRDAAQGLVAIERAGLVHRDIKPSNLFITEDGTAKLADLGLARSQTGDDRMTQSGMIVGTPAFMAPEQANAQAVDVRTDIYALGATLFQLVSGRAPFEGPSSMAIVAKVISDATPDLRQVAPDVSAVTADVVARAMAKSPVDRYPDAQAFLDALRDALAALDRPASAPDMAWRSSGRSPAAPAAPARAAAASARRRATSGRAPTAPRVAAPDAAPDAEARSARVAAAAIGAALLVMLGLGLSLVLSSPRDEDTRVAQGSESTAPATEAPPGTGEAPPSTASEPSGTTESLPPPGPADLPPADLPPADLPPADLPPSDLPPTDLPPTDLPPTDLPPVDPPPTDPREGPRRPPNESGPDDRPSPDDRPGPGGPRPEHGSPDRPPEHGSPDRPPEHGSFDERPDRGLMPLLHAIQDRPVGALDFDVSPAGAATRGPGGGLTLAGDLVRLEGDRAHEVPFAFLWAMKDLASDGQTIDLALRSGSARVERADELAGEDGLLVRLSVERGMLEVEVQPLGERTITEHVEFDADLGLGVGLRATADDWTVVVAQGSGERMRGDGPRRPGGRFREGGSRDDRPPRRGPRGEQGDEHDGRPPPPPRPLMVRSGRWSLTTKALRPWARIEAKVRGERPVIAGFVRALD